MKSVAASLRCPNEMKIIFFDFFLKSGRIQISYCDTAVEGTTAYELGISNCIESNFGTNISRSYAISSVSVDFGRL